MKKKCICRENIKRKNMRAIKKKSVTIKFKKKTKKMCLCEQQNKKKYA